MPVIEHFLDAVPLTAGPKFHWFGYYDKFPWDSTGRFVLSLEVDFMDRPPVPGDIATVGMVDLQDGNRFIPLAQTAAWNWQQGTHLQWLPTAPDREIIYNSLEGDRYVSVIQDVHTGARRQLPLPIYAVSRDGKKAVTLNFSRVHSTRPGYGYNSLMHQAGPDLTDEDGIWVMDLETGEHELIVTLKQVYDIVPQDTFEGARHWFNHLQFSTDSRRFIFLHRWRHGSASWGTRLFTAGPDGSDVCLLNDNQMTSHFDWCGPDKVLAWATRFDIGDRYFLFHDCSDKIEIVGEDVFTCDGHCSYSPDGKWIMTDTYPDAEKKRTLILYRVADNTRIDIGRFYSVPVSDNEFRCDLHPRWSRDGKQVCFDSTHEEQRQLYVIDVSEVVGG
jgi:hypothetical protein